jgi:hypothetical protein
VLKLFSQGRCSGSLNGFCMVIDSEYMETRDGYSDEPADLTWQGDCGALGEIMNMFMH